MKHVGREAMILNIAIVDDQEIYVQQLKKFLVKWAKAKNCTLQVASYLSAEQFLKQKNFCLDVIFLDIQLGKYNGIKLAKYLRKKGVQSPLIFLTSFQEYVFSGYDVQALQYLIKPPTYSMIEKCMNQVQQLSQTEHYAFFFKNEYIKIPYQDILYFSSANHYIEIHTKNQLYSQKQKLSIVKNLLPSFFLQCHRCLIVNSREIEKILKKEIFLSNDEVLPISATYLSKIRSALLNTSLL